MFQLDFRSRKPIYEQIVDNVKKLIINGVLKQDEKIMSVRELSKILTSNPNTVQKAYRELERQGYIYSIPSKGNFVAKLKKGDEVEALKQIEIKMKDILSEAIYKGISKEKVFGIVEEIYNKFKQSREEIHND